MNDVSLKIVTAPTAESLCVHCELSDDARLLLTPSVSPARYMDALIRAGYLIDAARFMAFALPGPGAVWWACLCARASLTDDARAEEVQALAAVEQWVMKPSDEGRRPVYAFAEQLEFDCASAWAACAVFWSGGDIGPTESPTPVQPGPQMVGTAVAGAVMLAAVAGDPEQADARYRRFIEQAVDIGNGGWGTEPAPLFE